jgi:nucleoside-diphosphate-sugar epimerase
MLVAVTGGTGFVGSHTVTALHAAGHRVRLLVRDPLKLKRVLLPRGVEVDDWVQGDVTDEASVARLLEGCDALVHTAAVVALESARASEVRRTNERGVRLVLGSAIERGLRRIVYVSSAGALFTPGGAPLTARSPVGVPTSAYSESKARAERWVREQQERGQPIQTVYPTAVVGPDDPGLTDPNRALAFFLAYGAVVTSTGYQPVDVRDLARMHVALLEPERPAGRFVTTGPYLAWPELCDRIERLTGRRLLRWRVPGGVLRGLGHAADVVKRVVPFDLPVTHEGMVFATSWPTADGTPAARELGVRYRDIDETLADTLRWMCAAGHLTPRQIGALASSAR